MNPLPGRLDAKRPMSESLIYPAQKFLFAASFIKHKYSRVNTLDLYQKNQVRGCQH
jgi:hypothetical protein